MLAALGELLVPSRDLVGVLGRPERKWRPSLEQILGTEPDEAAKGGVDRSDAARLDEEQAVGDRSEEIPGEVGLRGGTRCRGMAHRVDPEGEQGDEDDHEGSGSRSAYTDIRGACASEDKRCERHRGQGDDQTQPVTTPRCDSLGHHVASTRMLRSNLCHARSPRRNRHVPLSRAHAMIGR